MDAIKEQMKLWEQLRAVPDTAKRRIQGGHLNGKTDINPVWRMKRLTELFGPCGFGWNVKEVERWTNECAGEVAAFVKVELRVFSNGQWSEPIEGTGGSKLCGKGRGEGINDEAWKMATTDAISVACKSLGLAADVYFEKDAYLGTKYEATASTAPSRASRASNATETGKNEELPTGCTPATYWAIVRAYGDGKTSKTGGDYRAEFIEHFKPTEDQLAKFDHDVENYRLAQTGGATL